MKELLRSDLLRGRAIRYGIAGAAAMLLYFALVAALVETRVLPPVTAAAAGTAATILFQYVVNRAWIFPTDRSHVSAIIRFLLASGLGMALNTGLMHLAVHILVWPYWAGLVLATAVVPPTNFLINQFWAFRPGA
jgi:putative flippase GtrA